MNEASLLVNSLVSTSSEKPSGPQPLGLEEASSQTDLQEVQGKENNDDEKSSRVATNGPPLHQHLNMRNVNWFLLATSSNRIDYGHHLPL